MRLHVDKLQPHDLGGITRDMMKINHILGKFDIDKSSLVRPGTIENNIPTIIFHAGRYVVVFQYDKAFTKGAMAFINYSIDLSINIDAFADFFTPKTVGGFHEMQTIIQQKSAKELNLVELTDEPLISQTISKN